MTSPAPLIPPAPKKLAPATPVFNSAPVTSLKPIKPKCPEHITPRPRQVTPPQPIKPTSPQHTTPMPRQVTPLPQPTAAPTLSAAMKKGGYVTKGGRLNLGSDRVFTATKNKSNKNW